MGWRACQKNRGEKVKKIVFICGSMEKGKDGVGDYTRRLSAELIRTGNQAKIIALNDRHLPAACEEFQNEEGIPVPVLRLPENCSWNERIQTAKNFISEFEPHFLSLQYVPFAFDRKGLPIGLAGKLRKITSRATWHIMFHELWIGIDEESSVKHKITGFLQKRLAKDLVSKLSPVAVHTQTRLYQFLLARLGQDAILLPLFGNIPISWSDIKKYTGSGPTLQLVLFGGIHYGAPVKEFIEDIASYASEKRTGVKITFIGLNGAELETWLSECNKANVPVSVLGKQSLQVISETLLNADFGITTTPVILTEKSGSVAAMKEHHLPVICVARKWIPNTAFPFVPDINTYEYRAGTLRTYLQHPHSVPALQSLSDIANQFINDLT